MDRRGAREGDGHLVGSYDENGVENEGNDGSCVMRRRRCGMMITGDVPAKEEALPSSLSSPFPLFIEEWATLLLLYSTH